MAQQIRVSPSPCEAEIWIPGDREITVGIAKLTGLA